MSSSKPDKEVRITLDAKGFPVPDVDPVPVWRNEQKLKWSADFDFKISIDGYPDADVVHSKGGGKNHHCKTGYFGDGASKSYKYTISANGIDNDPTIEIKP
jgi:hypothetical protein